MVLSAPQTLSLLPELCQAPSIKKKRPYQQPFPIDLEINAPNNRPTHTFSSHRENRLGSTIAISMCYE
jgi:hypothetical protein